MQLENGFIQLFVSITLLSLILLIRFSLLLGLSLLLSHLKNDPKSIFILDTPHKKLTVTTPLLENLISKLLQINELATRIIELVHLPQSIIIFDKLIIWQFLLESRRVQSLGSAVLEVAEELVDALGVFEAHLGLVRHYVLDVLEWDVGVSVGGIVR